MPVNEVIRRETPYSVRYAFNYCTLSYTLAFFGQEDWQRELDWLALNGVNVVLDLNGQEAVWHNFLKKVGYTDEEAKDWLTGPGYYAWQFMSNMETFNGPVSDTWIKERLDLARRNQHFMRVLGMEPVYQAYSGEIPVNIKEKDPDIDIVSQGYWMRFDRPSMIRTTSESYQKYSTLFYEAQEEVLGANTHYYATDPFHEGGNKGDMDEAEIGEIVYDKLKEVHPDATWIIQSWSLQADTISRLSEEEKENGLLVLDLEADKFPRYDEVKEGSFSEPEFDGTPWVFYILDNFGGRQGVQAELDLMANLYEEVYLNTKHMKGIGLSSEGTWANPIQYELLFESAWHEGPVDLDEWIDQYVERRYGASTPQAQAAWDIFRKTAYAYPKGGHTGNPESVINATPRFNIAYVAPQGSVNIPYDPEEFEKGVELLLQDYDQLKNSDGYRFDVTDMLRQYLSNTALDYYRKFTSAYQDHDWTAFDYYSQKFLDLILLQDQVLGTNKEFLVGTWIQRAIDLSEAYDEDDFSKDMLERNARALITTWGSYEMSSLIFSHDGVNYSGGTLQDYANRQYAGLTKDYYYPRWEKWISSLRETFDEEDYEDYTFDEGFELGWNWSLDHNAYTTEASGDVKELAKKIFVEYGLNDDFRIHIDITDENGMKLSEQEIFAHRDIPADIVLDLDENEKITGIEAGDVRYSMDGNILHVEEIEKDAVITVIVAAAIADRSELNEAITAAKALHGKDHTADSWTAMQKALAAAEQVAADDSATQEQIDDAADALNTAIGALQAKASDAAMAALQNIVDKATALQEDSLAEHIANAQTLLDDPDNASLNAVISVMLDLSEAMQALNTDESTDALRQDLKATIDFINENILPNIDNVRPGKVQALKDAITAAQKLLANEDAAADQLKAANKAMTKAPRSCGRS